MFAQDSQDSQDSIDNWQEGPGAAIFRVVRGRLNTLVHACDMLRAAVPADPLAESIHQAANVMTQEVEALRRSRSMPPEQEIEQLISRVDRIESALLIFDSTVPMLLFRRRVEVDLFPRSVVVDYVTLLAGHLGTDKDRRDRVDLLATMVCSAPGAGERRQMRPRSEVKAFLEGISGGQRCPADRKEAAIAFFEKARWRIAGFKDPEQVFKTGLFSDVYGLKVALGQDFLDPQILYTVVEANITLRNQLAQKKEKDQDVREEAQATEAKEALATSNDTATLAETSRFERLRAQEVQDDPQSHRAWEAIRRRWVLRTVGAMVAVAGIAWSFLDAPPAPPRMTLDAAAIHALSDTLISAQIIGRGRTRALVAELDNYAWGRLDAKGRQELANGLAGRLKETQRLGSALLRSDGKLAARIQAGQVVMVR